MSGQQMATLFFATIVLMTTIAIVIMSWAVFSEPFALVNQALRDNAANSSNANLSEDVDRVTEKTDQMWFQWPVIFIGGLIVWYILWGNKWQHERY